MKSYTAIDRVTFAGLLITIVFTALAFGTVDPWSVAIFQLLVILLGVLWAARMVAEGRIYLDIPAVALPILAFLCLGVVQSVSFTQVGGRTVSLSRDVEATRGSALALLTLAVCFLIAVNILRDRRRLALFVDFLIGFGMLMAVFALIQHFAGNGRIYWFRYNRQGASTFGPFINHNHFAGYMEMLIPLPIAIMLRGSPGSTRFLYYGFAAAIMTVALVTSLSRGGMISLAVALAALALWNRNGRRRRSAHIPGASVEPQVDGSERRGKSHGTPGVIVLVLLLCATTAGVVWLAPERVIDRITGSLSSSPSGAPLESGETFFTSRGQIWKETLSMIGANPLIGVGLGAYEAVYPAYSASDGSLFVRYAHNDYLQVLADTGAFGGAILIWFLIMTAKLIAANLRSRDSFVAALAMGSGAAIVAILVHSTLDFNLQLPSNALLFLTLIALASSLNAIPALRRSPSRVSSQRIAASAVVL